MAEYYDPMLFINSPENPLTMGVMAVLKEDVNGSFLDEAVEDLRERFPYFYIRAAIEGNNIVAVPNPLPVMVRNSWDPTLIASKEANYHHMALKYKGKRIELEMNHAISDGAGMLPFFKSLLFLYLSKKTGESFPRDGFKLPGDTIPESETGDPFAGVDTDSLEAPLYEKEPIQDYYRFNISAGEKQHIHCLKLPVNDVMRYCRENDGSPNVLISVLISRAVRRIDHDSPLPVTVSVAINHKAMLGNHDNYRMFANAYAIDFPKERENEDILRMCTISRGKLMLQTQPENSAWYVKTRKMGFEKMKQMPLEMKMDMLPKSAMAKRWTASVSYADSRSFGCLDPYIDELYLLSDGAAVDILCEVACINDSFYLALVQNFESDGFFNAFLDELKDAAVPYEIEGNEEFHPSGFRYDDLE